MEPQVEECPHESIRFRAGAGAVILNNKGEVLAFERRKHPGTWQFPQGGLEPEENHFETVFRELKEETGIFREHVALISNKPRLLAYEVPEDYRSFWLGRGQAIYFYLFLFLADDSVINLNYSKKEKPEFRDWDWMTMEQLIPKTNPFRQPTYKLLHHFILNPHL